MKCNSFPAQRLNKVQRYLPVAVPNFPSDLQNQKRRITTGGRHLRCVTTYSPATLALSILATTADISLFSLPSPPTASLHLSSPSSPTPETSIPRLTSPSSTLHTASARSSTAASSARIPSRTFSEKDAATREGTLRFSVAISARRSSSSRARSRTRWCLRSSKAS